ncbi:hypothetical protein AMTR_s00002p00149570 [Amborella trichopoda]|uniref:Uncharacterized protein n=1 Tax=Amborella trichopoda TaxID=13333 RepID=W1P083_AMBTC|nr:hypothetical protein AMTR_s00002p00149570 [Amborella trichopoda]
MRGGEVNGWDQGRGTGPTVGMARDSGGWTKKLGMEEEFESMRPLTPSSIRQRLEAPPLDRSLVFQRQPCPNADRCEVGVVIVPIVRAIAIAIAIALQEWRLPTMRRSYKIFLEEALFV